MFIALILIFSVPGQVIMPKVKSDHGIPLLWTNPHHPHLWGPFTVTPNRSSYKALHGWLTSLIFLVLSTLLFPLLTPCQPHRPPLWPVNVPDVLLFPGFALLFLLPGMLLPSIPESPLSLGSTRSYFLSE